MKTMSSQTVRMRVGCGNLFVTLDHENDELARIMATLGRSGHCTMGFCTAIADLSTYALKLGGYKHEINEILKKIHCPLPRTDEGVTTLSCADAIGQAIMLKEAQ